MNETTTPTPELAPCPRCGARAFFTEITGFSDETVLGYQVDCGHPCGLSFDADCATMECAAAAWNALALDVQRGKLAAKLAEKLRWASNYLDLVNRVLTDQEVLTRGREIAAKNISVLDDALAEYDALTAKEAAE